MYFLFHSAKLAIESVRQWRPRVFVRFAACERNILGHGARGQIGRPSLFLNRLGVAFFLAIDSALKGKALPNRALAKLSLGFFTVLDAIESGFARFLGLCTRGEGEVFPTSPVALPEAVSATCGLQWKPPRQTMRVRRGAQGGLSLGELTGYEAFRAVFHVGSNAFPFNSEVFIIFRRFQEAR